MRPFSLVSRANPSLQAGEISTGVWLPAFAVPARVDNGVRQGVCDLSEKTFQAEEGLIVRLRSGDETAFAGLVDDLHCRLLTLARTFTSSPALAEDIVQETWLAVIRGLRSFEGRSSLRTWIFSILVRRARTVAGREARRTQIQFEASNGSLTEWEPGRGRQGLWEESPESWGLGDPAAVLGTREILEVVQKAFDRLPEMQRQVVLLRDIEGVRSSDVCNILEISNTNQRVLLHRGRARVRRSLDQYLRLDRKQQVLRQTSPANASRPTFFCSPRRVYTREGA
jgi:RNA polymerase sigma-70 factor, ECF subfamily